MLLLPCLLVFLIGAEGKNYGPVLRAPARLETGDFMTSNNSQYHAILQADGNFVIYRGSLADRPENAWWRTGTDGRSNGPYHLDLQNDNNLVLYDLHQEPVWRAKAKGKGPPPSTLTLHDDGNLVLRDADSNQRWSSGGDLKGRANRLKNKPKIHS